MPFPGYEHETGWAVFCPAPWHLIGVYATAEEAKAKLSQVGAGYDIAFGEHRLGSDDFVILAGREG